jgi:hypothetical protein
MNTLLHAIYDDSRLAEQVIQQLTETGIAKGAILLVTAAMATSAAGRAHMGSFADSEAHMHDTERDHVGSFADSEAHMHDTERDHVGSFADSGAHMHDAERDRAGSFADRALAAPIVPLVDDLVRAGLSQPDAQAAAVRLDTGASLLLVRAEGEQAIRAAALLQSASQILR